MKIDEKIDGATLTSNDCDNSGNAPQGVPCQDLEPETGVRAVVTKERIGPPPGEPVAHHSQWVRRF